jgi:hypothetical protein
MLRVLALAVVLTFVLGTVTATAFFVAGGTTALIGPYVLARQWPLIYGVELFLAFLAAFALGRAGAR